MDKLRCFHCFGDRISLDETFTFEDLGAEGEGMVYFYTCHDCGADIEVWVADREDQKEGYLEEDRYERSE